MIYAIAFSSVLLVLAGILIIMSNQRVRHLCQRLENRDIDVRALIKANECLSNENYELKHGRSADDEDDEDGDEEYKCSAPGCCEILGVDNPPPPPPPPSVHC